MSEEELMELGGFLVHTVVSLLNYAIRSDDPKTIDRVITEIKRMLIAYLFSVAQGQQIPALNLMSDPEN